MSMYSSPDIPDLSSDAKPNSMFGPIKSDIDLFEVRLPRSRASMVCTGRENRICNARLGHILIAILPSRVGYLQPRVQIIAIVE